MFNSARLIKPGHYEIQTGMPLGGSPEVFEPSPEKPRENAPADVFATSGAHRGGRGDFIWRAARAFRRS
jgi:hypothetical protein